MFLRLGFLLGLALAPAFTLPAQALIEVVGSDHVRFAWAPATGPVAGYRVYVTRDGGALELYSFVENRTDETLYGDYGETVVMRVAATDAAGNEGPLSPPSEAVRFVEAAPPPEPPPADPAPARHDFDGDGRSDIWLTDPETGRPQLWAVGADGFALLTELPTLPRGWEIVASLDANGDGYDDILWRDAESGRVDLWLLEGGRLVGGDMVRGPEGPEWTVATAGDFDADGRGDILMWHPASGDLEVWLMDATVVAEVVAWTNGPTAAAGWSAGGGGDYDGDGIHDVLWRQASQGRLEAWLVRSPDEVAPAVFDDALDAGWEIEGSGDADGNGADDVVLRARGLGRVEALALDGAVFAYPDPGTDHEIVDVGDFDADGRLDLLWSSGDGAHPLFLSTTGDWSQPGDPWDPEDSGGGTTETCRGDLDQDGHIGFADFTALRRCYGQGGNPECSRADLDGDGVVGVSDFSLFRQAFGSACGG